METVESQFTIASMITDNKNNEINNEEINPALLRYCMDTEFRQRIRTLATLQMMERYNAHHHHYQKQCHEEERNTTLHNTKPDFGPIKTSADCVTTDGVSRMTQHGYDVRHLLADKLARKACCTSSSTTSSTATSSVGSTLIDCTTFTPRLERGGHQGHRRYGPIVPEARDQQEDGADAVKKYRCDLCPKSFSRSNTLVTHRRIHTGEKPFSCNLCGRAFRQPGNLTRHKLTHTSVKPFICSVCRKAFNRASNLHTHMRTHSASSLHLGNIDVVPATLAIS